MFYASPVLGDVVSVFHGTVLRPAYTRSSVIDILKLSPVGRRMIGDS